MNDESQQTGPFRYPGNSEDADAGLSATRSDPTLPEEKKRTTRTTGRSHATFDVETLGQIFTPQSIVRVMLALRRNNGRVLEPSCGNGAFSKHLPGCVALEIDRYHAPSSSLEIDFFAFPQTEKFETIIGNPPYVRYQSIREETKRLFRSSLLDLRSNLYLFFIEKALHHLTHRGELIFITPRGFLKATSSTRINQLLYSCGTITHAIEMGDVRPFGRASPNCLIWRYEKSCYDRTMHYLKIKDLTCLQTAFEELRWEKRRFYEAAGQLLFVSEVEGCRLRDIASVKVGAVSGADTIYADDEHGNTDFVCSQTVKTGRTRRMIWIGQDEGPPDVLLPYKEQLIARRVRDYTESNWWQWGRVYPYSEAPRVYVNGKTREPSPFFLHDCNHYDGSVLALFPHDPAIDLADFCRALNAVAWEELGFVCGGRFLFTQRSLENALLPISFTRFLSR